MRSFALTLLLSGVLAAPALAQLPESAKSIAGGKSWHCISGYVERGRNCVRLGSATDSEIRRYLITESLAAYPGNCPCPNSLDHAGRQCGRRSAYSKAGGYSPLCYPRDIPDAQVRRARAEHPPD